MHNDMEYDISKISFSPAKTGKKPKRIVKKKKEKKEPQNFGELVTKDWVLSELMKAYKQAQNIVGTKGLLVRRDLLKEISALLKLKEEVIEKEDRVVFVDDVEQFIKEYKAKKVK